MPSFEMEGSDVAPRMQSPNGATGRWSGGTSQQCAWTFSCDVEFSQGNRGKDEREEGKAATPEVQWWLRGTPFASGNKAFRR